MEVIPDPAPEIRAIIKELSKVIVDPSWTSAIHVHTALVVAVDAFCKASGTPHHEFWENLRSLRDKNKNPCG